MVAAPRPCDARRVSAVFVDYYEVLALDPRADEAAIKAAYRACMLRDHVDQNPDDPHAKERTIVLARAKQVLLDPQRRREFDLQRALWLAGHRIGGSDVLPDTRHVEVDLRDVSLGKLLVGAGVAVVLGGLFVAAKVVADHRSNRPAGRRRR